MILERCTERLIDALKHRLLKEFSCDCILCKELLPLAIREGQRKKILKELTKKTK